MSTSAPVALSFSSFESRFKVSGGIDFLICSAGQLFFTITKWKTSTEHVVQKLIKFLFS